MVIDDQGILIAWNQAMETMTGVRAADMVGKGDYEYALPFYGERRPVMIDLVTSFDENVSAQYQFIRSEGERWVSETFMSDLCGRGPAWLWNVAAPLYDDTGRVVGAIESIRDITEIKQVELTLRDSEEKYRTILESTALVVTISTVATGEYIEINQGFTELTGYERDEAVGRTSSELGVYHDPEDRKRLGRMLLETGECIGQPIKYVRKDGSLLDAILSARLIKYGGVECVASVVQDVTMLRQAEKAQAQLQAQLQQAQKMEAVGTLAGGIAHDFNNILSAVFGYTELALNSLENRTNLERYLTEILGAAERARDLVNHILTFSRKAEADRKPMIPRYIIKESLKLLRASLPSTIEIQESLSSSAAVSADPTQIHQITMNLCTNAGYAMRDQGGVLEVSLEETTVREDFTEHHPGMAPGPYLCLRVDDSGRGIPREVLERIFDPFFTTKPPGEGTGLGLSAVHGIAKSLGGTVTVESEMGHGAVFFSISAHSPNGSRALGQGGQGTAPGWYGAYPFGG